MKKRNLTKLIAAAALLLFFLVVGQVSATLFCARPYSELKRNPGKPYNAVGFLNNGCTATLIDENHIVAAAHCFADIGATGAWFSGLRFYPNFHPRRVTADEKHVPRADVVRVVVDSRAGASVLGDGMDWGIARLGPWKDAAGLDLTPVRLGTFIPSNGSSLVNPAYTRHHFPYNDQQSPHWDDMEWDSTNCGWVGPNQGMWAMKMRTAPIYDGVNRDMVGCNSRWIAGTIHANCALAKVEFDVLVHNCDTIGGSSGSPILFLDGNGKWNLIGVGYRAKGINTGSSNDFSQLTPLCNADIPENRDNLAVSVSRFRDAPRFAANVAVHRSPLNPSGTAIYAVDSDLRRVVFRMRTGAPLTYSSHFTYWSSLDSPMPGVKLNRIAACTANTPGKPQIFVNAKKKQLYTRSADGAGIWSAWSAFDVPGSVKRVLDLDAATDANGRCVLFMAAKGAGAFARFKTSNTAWGSWQKIADGSYKAVTVLNYNGIIWAALLDTSGEIWRTSFTGNSWTAPIKLPRPGSIGAWRDIDLTWDEAARGFMLAIPASWNSGSPGPTNTLWFTPLYGSQPWNEWRIFENHLWAPGAPLQNPPNLKSITASRWMEDPPGTTSPVIFGTDDTGNIYLVEYARVGAVGWNLNWKSFYHDFIPYP